MHYTGQVWWEGCTGGVITKCATMDKIWISFAQYIFVLTLSLWMTEQLRMAGLFFTTKLSTGCSVNSGSLFSDAFWTDILLVLTTLLDRWLSKMMQLYLFALTPYLTKLTLCFDIKSCWDNLTIDKKNKKAANICRGQHSVITWANHRRDLKLWQSLIICITIKECRHLLVHVNGNFFIFLDHLEADSHIIKCFA